MNHNEQVRAANAVFRAQWFDLTPSERQDLSASAGDREIVSFKPSIPLPGLAPDWPHQTPQLPAYPAPLPETLKDLICGDTARHRLALRLLAEIDRRQESTATVQQVGYNQDRRFFDCGNCYVSNLLRGGDHNEHELVCGTGRDVTGPCFHCSHRGWDCRPLPRRYPFSLDVGTTEAYWWVDGGKASPRIEAVRRRALHNLLVWENLHGSSVTTHPDARQGLLFSAAIGGRQGRRAQLAPLPQSEVTTPWLLEDTHYLLPTPRDLLVGLRYYEIAQGQGGYFSHPDDAVHTKHASEEELGQVNKDLQRLGLPPLVNRRSVLASCTAEPRRVAHDGFTQDPNDARRIRVVSPLAPWAESA